MAYEPRAATFASCTYLLWVNASIPLQQASAQPGAPQRATDRARGRIGMTIGSGGYRQTLEHGTKDIAQIVTLAAPVVGLQEDAEWGAMDEVAVGGRFNYFTTLGQTVSVDTTADRGYADAQHQTVRAAALVRVPLLGPTPAFFVLLAGVGLEDFRSERAPPSADYTVWQGDLRPSVRLGCGMLEIEGGPEIGINVLRLNQRDATRVGALGWNFGGHITADLAIQHHIALRAWIEYRQGRLSTDSEQRSITYVWYFATLGAAFYF